LDAPKIIGKGRVRFVRRIPCRFCGIVNLRRRRQLPRKFGPPATQFTCKSCGRTFNVPRGLIGGKVPNPTNPTCPRCGRRTRRCSGADRRQARFKCKEREITFNLSTRDKYLPKPVYAEERSPIASTLSSAYL